MTPQEQQLVAELFDRLSKLETAPRDPDAARLIADGAQQAPHALYTLVQTALVQDEALKRANARIQDLQQQLEAQSGGEQPQQQGSFLDSMRDAVFGHAPTRGSVPNVQPPAAGAAGSVYQSQGYAPPRAAAPAFPAQPPYATQPGYPTGAGFASGGGSFLGTAASVAAGAVGGGLLLDGIRSMFGHRTGAAGSDPFAFAVPRDDVSPWRGDAADSDLARQAGIDDIGRKDMGPTDTGPRDGFVNQADDSNLTDASDDQFVDDDNDDNFDTADSSGSGDDSYDV